MQNVPASPRMDEVSGADTILQEKTASPPTLRTGGEGGRGTRPLFPFLVILRGQVRPSRFFVLAVVVKNCPIGGATISNRRLWPPSIASYGLVRNRVGKGGPGAHPERCAGNIKSGAEGLLREPRAQPRSGPPGGPAAMGRTARTCGRKFSAARVKLSIRGGIDSISRRAM